MSLKLPAPTFTTYIPPTTPPLTQFTPAPTCYPTTAGQQMWHVTGLCYPYPHPPNGPAKDWEVPRPVCTYTRAGNPQENKPECGNRWGSPGNVEGIIGSCPVGFTSAGVDLGYPLKPFDRTSWGPTPTTEVFDVTASAIICCPSVSGLQFKARSTGNVYTHTSTFYNGVLFTMDVPVPYCYAHPATALDKKTVTMGVYHDSRVFDRKAKREEHELAQRQESINFADWPWETPGWGGWGGTGKTTTAVFNAQRDTIWAEEVRYHYTVFHGTHTCYESCHDYFTNSYYNTDPNFTPTTTPEMTTTSTPPVAQSSHAQPSGGFSYPYGGGGGAGSPPYPTKGYDNGAPYPTKTYDHDAPYPTYGNGGGGSSGGGGEYKPGKGNEGQGGNKPPLYSGRPPLQSSINEPVQAGASGMRVGSLAMLSTLAVGFLGVTLAL